MTQIPAEQFGWMHGEEVPAYLAEHQASFKDTGLWPVVVGDPESLALLLDTYEIYSEDGDTAEQALKSAAAENIERWLDFHAEESGIEDPEIFGDGVVSEQPGPGLLTALNTGGSKPLPEVGVGLFRVKHPWEVLAQLLWTAPNYDMGPKIHCAIQYRWSERYGADVVSATGDVIQCRVLRPPSTTEAALELAREQYIYCPDIVTQGVGTVTELAGTLLNADYWYFWWD